MYYCVSFLTNQAVSIRLFVYSIFSARALARWRAARRKNSKLLSIWLIPIHLNKGNIFLQFMIRILALVLSRFQLRALLTLCTASPPVGYRLIHLYMERKTTSGYWMIKSEISLLTNCWQSCFDSSLHTTAVLIIPSTQTADQAKKKLCCYIIFKVVSFRPNKASAKSRLASFRAYSKISDEHIRPSCIVVSRDLLAWMVQHSFLVSTESLCTD